MTNNIKYKYIVTVHKLLSMTVCVAAAGTIDTMMGQPVMHDENTCVKIKATKTDQQLIIKY